jgi:hypothetical protein
VRSRTAAAEYCMILVVCFFQKRSEFLLVPLQSLDKIDQFCINLMSIRFKFCNLNLMLIRLIIFSETKNGIH